MSTSWMECSIRQPPPACVASARHWRAVRPLNGEVLVVAEHRRHRRTQRPALHQVTQGPEDRRTAQHETALAGDACGLGRLDQLRGAWRGRRRVASRRRRRVQRPGPRPPRPGAPTSACRPRRRRCAGPPRAASPTTATSSAPTTSAKLRARRSRWSWTATIAASTTPPSIRALRLRPWAHAIRPDPTKPTRSMPGD